jgi:hypothetical protein
MNEGICENPNCPYAGETVPRDGEGYCEDCGDGHRADCSCSSCTGGRDDGDVIYIRNLGDPAKDCRHLCDLRGSQSCNADCEDYER